MVDFNEAYVLEQEARIRQLQADVMLKTLDTLKRAQDIRYAPFTLLITGVGAGAALFGAAIAIVKWIG
jgi:hypothetical protein